jgi:hypothetical protein
MKVLYLTTVLPNKKQTGGEIVTQFFVDAIGKAGHDICVLGYQRKDDFYSPSENEISLGERYIEVDKSGMHSLMWLGLSLLKRIPYSAAKYYSKNYLRQLGSILELDKYDVFVIDHAQVAWLSSLIKEKNRLIFFAHNVENRVYQENSLIGTQNFFLKKIYARESSMIKQVEEDIAASAGEVWTISADDQDYFTSITHKSNVRLFAVPSHVAAAECTVPRKTFDVGLIGTWTWKANFEGLRWFFQEVYPVLTKELSIRVAGRGAEWLVGKYPNVEYCGFVPDANIFMSQAKVIAIPAVSGGGLQIKTLDAIASGSAIVAAPLALRGLFDCPSCVTVAESPEIFASSIMRLLSNFLDQSTSQVESYNESITWSKTRREKFFFDVAQALTAFAASE